MAKVVVALSWSTGSKKGRCRSEINKKNNNNWLRIWSIVRTYEQHHRYVPRKRSLWREAIRCSRAKMPQQLLVYEHLVPKIVQKLSKNYWCKDTWCKKLCEYPPRIIDIRTPGTKKCENAARIIVVRTPGTKNYAKLIGGYVFEDWHSSKSHTKKLQFQPHRERIPSPL